MTILFFSSIIFKYHNIFHLCKKNNIKALCSLKENFDVIFACVRHNKDFLNKMRKKGYFVINLDVPGTSKVLTDKVHNQVFGYGAIVDPLTYNGEMVVKSDSHAHNGKIIQGPLSPLKVYKKINTVYQMKIDTLRDGYYQEHRTHIIDRKPVFVFVKNKAKIENTFRRHEGTNKLSYGTPDKFFDPDQIKLIEKFCSSMKVDIADIDILIDSKTKKLYIIDVNLLSCSAPILFYKSYQRFKREKVFTDMSKESFLNFRRQVKNICVPAFKNFINKCAKNNPIKLSCKICNNDLHIKNWLNEEKCPCGSVDFNVSYEENEVKDEYNTNCIERLYAKNIHT